MTQTEDPIASRAAAASAESGLSGDIMSATATCPKTALEIGVFFDGTYNNAVNSGIGGETGSYANARTNISLLGSLYKSGPGYDVKNEGGSGVCRKFFSLYVPGVGTTDGGADNRFGAAVGMGETGVSAIVARTALELGDQINRLSPGIEPEEVILDVFGFSRGAAEARYFVNAFRRGWIDHNPISGDRVRGRVPEGRNIRIRFLGIFDTVASIGLGWVEYNYGVSIHLKPDQADRIFHLTADNEYRVNFRLNHNLPDGGDHQPMPGVHGDIGGGYRETGDLAPLAGSRTYSFPFLERAEEYRDHESRRNLPTPEEAAPWIAEGWIRPDQTSALQKRVSPVTTQTTSGMMGIPTDVHSYEVTRVLDRPWVKLGLSRIAMAAMHRRASETKVPLLDLPTGGEYEIPKLPRRIEERIIGGEHITGPDAMFVVNNYAHVSANPDSTGMSGESNRTRRIYWNRPGEAI